MEGKDLHGQIGAIVGARCIVAPHGAGLAHMIHAAPGAVIIELLPEHYPNGSFFALAGACGFRYGCIRARAAPGAGRPNSSSDLVVEPHDVLSLVRAALP
jgi:capsular polysaccharide biosynthesis protein